MSRRTWRGIRTPKYDVPALATEVMTSSRFHGSGGEPERDPALDDEEEDDDRDRDQRRRGHQLAPVGRALRAEDVRQPDGDRLARAAVQDDPREDVLVPARDESEHGRR